MNSFLPLLTLLSATCGLRYDPSPICMKKCPKSEPRENRPCVPEDMYRCNCVYDNTDCFRCTADPGGSGGGTWTLECAGVLPSEDDKVFDDYEEDEEASSAYNSMLTLAYAVSPEKEVAMMAMAMKRGRVLHPGHYPTEPPTYFPTKTPTLQPTTLSTHHPVVCDVSECAEMECCGPNTSYEYDLKVCLFDARSTGWDGVTRPHDPTNCHERNCEESECCDSPLLVYDHTQAACTWDPDAWSLAEMQHYIDSHLCGEVTENNCHYVCHGSEEHCMTMCKTFEGEVEAACLKACFELQIACHRSCPDIDNLPEFLDDHDHDHKDVIVDHDHDHHDHHDHHDDLVRDGKF